MAGMQDIMLGLIFAIWHDILPKNGGVHGNNIRQIRTDRYTEACA